MNAIARRSSETYQIEFFCRKTVARLNPRTLTAGEPNIDGEWSNRVESHARPSRSTMIPEFTSFLFPLAGITVHHLSHIPGRPGHFTITRLEDSRGAWIPPSQEHKAKYLATYDVQVGYRRVEPLKPFDDTMGLPPASA